MNRSAASLVAAVLVAGAIFTVVVPGLGRRHLWLDEIETAERARTILESGWPRVIDAAGRPSVNAAGREIEEGVTHRYTPWGQYYWAAAGLAVGRWTGLSPDTAVRLPFAAAHAATSGIVTHALAGVAGLPVGPAVVLGTAWGVQSVRLLHNRTARYHALLDLLTAAGFWGLTALLHRSGRDRVRALRVLRTVLFLLPMVHTLGGLAPALILGTAAAFLLRRAGEPRSLLRIFLPLAVSLILVAILVRPWIDRGWGGLTIPDFRSLRDTTAISYAVLFAILALVAARRAAVDRRDRVRQVGILLATIVLVIAVFDIYSFSQKRYYLSLSLLLLFWTFVVMVHRAGARAVRFWTAALLVALLFPDLYVGLRRRKGPQAPFHGLAVIAHDWRTLRPGSQPLAAAFEQIRTHGEPATEAVLVDFAPQFVNWYLPGYDVALMPDPTLKSAINAANPIWDRPRPLPGWHLSYLDRRDRNWACGESCDFRIEDLDTAAGTYRLVVRSTGAAVPMCLVGTWRSDRNANAPFRLLGPAAAFRDDGAGADTLGLARPCPAEPAAATTPAGGGS